MGINLGIIAETLVGMKSVEEKADVLERLTEAGLNPKGYNPIDHDYMPFLLKITMDGELQNFLQIIGDRYDLVARVFRVLHPNYIQGLSSKYKTAGKLEQAKIETKLIAIGCVARNTTDEQQDAMIAAYSEYDKKLSDAIAAEKAKQVKLVNQ